LPRADLTEPFMPQNDPYETKSAPGDPYSTNPPDLKALGSRNLVFDSGLVPIDDPRIIALHAGYDDLVKIFERPVAIF